jgi:hypothetical protein
MHCRSPHLAVGGPKVCRLHDLSPAGKRATKRPRCGDASGPIPWDDRGSNSDALAGGRFSYHFGFRRPAFVMRSRFVVWTVPWPLGSAWVPGRPRPSSLYTFRRAGNRRLGSALSGHRVPESSPNLSASRPEFPPGRLTCKSAVSAYSTIIPGAVVGLFDGRNEGLPRRSACLAPSHTR